MGYNRKSAAIAATNRCNPYIAEKYFILKTKPSLNIWREIFSSFLHRKKHLLQNYQWPVKEKQHKVGTTTKHTSFIPEESGGQATTLSSAWNTRIVWREFKVRSSISINFSHSWALINYFNLSSNYIYIYIYLTLFSLGLYLNNKKCSPCPNSLPNRSESNKNRLLVTQHVSNFYLLHQDRCRSSMVRSMASKNQHF